MQEIQDGRAIHRGAEPELDSAAAETAEPDLNPEQEAELEANAGMEIDPDDLQPKPWVLPERRRVLLAAGIVALLLLMVFLPPLISVNRFRHRIAQSVSESLGRPVRIDSVTLNVLPMPGFTLQNFIVEDDPAFGSEPVIRAETVKVTLRVWSLWRRRVEFSRISLDDPSVNLVHRADGRWNIESILLQAAKIEAAPTAQPGAGDEPRFPYIEATGARINVKSGLEKMPISLTEADLALWLTQPGQWKLRLEGHPSRTNTAATDTGTLQVQGTLGKASTLADAPVDLTAEWRAAPLGGVSWVMLARDAGFRGEMTLRATMQGTVGKNNLDTTLELNDVRRADFVPQRSLDVTIRCTAQAAATFHQLNDLRCGWPSGALTNGTANGLTVVAQVPDVSHWQKSAGDASLVGVSASGLLDMLRLTSRRVSPDLTAGGAISGKLTCCDAVPHTSSAGEWATIAGHLAIGKATMAIGKDKLFVETDVTGDLAGGALTIKPFALDLGAPQPAMLDGRIDANGFALHLDGPAMRTRLLQLAAALPPFGDGLDAALPEAPSDDAVEAPIRVDLESNRTWTTGQTWAATAAHPVKGRHGSKKR